MSRITEILRRSCQSSASQSLMETYVGPYVSSGGLRWLSSCAKPSRKPDISVANQIKVMTQYSAVGDMARIRRLPLSSRMDTKWLITSKSRHGALPEFLGISSFHRGYSSDTGIKPEASQYTVSNVPSTESPEVGTAGGGGGSWIEILDNARKSTVDATTDAGKKVKELTDAVTPHVQQLFDTYPNLEKVVVPIGGTLCGTMVAWLVMLKLRLGVMGLVEACGVAVQSILTVGGVGGVATAFAPKDFVGNILSGFSLQFSKPFSANGYMKAGPIQGNVVEIGLTSTYINKKQIPVIVPNSLFSSQGSKVLSLHDIHTSCGGPMGMVRNFSSLNCAEEESKDTPVAYLTHKSDVEIKIDLKLDSKKILLEDPPGYTNLLGLFLKPGSLCFEYTDVSETKHCFSQFSLDIFRNILAIIDEKGQDPESHFHFDASQILVKHDNTMLKQVAIPASQFKKGDSLYVDKVVGPFTTLVYSLCTCKGGGAYKEVLDLMVLAQHRRLTLQEVLGHPLFWSPEMKYSTIMACRIFLGTGVTNIKNPLSKGHGRTRNLTKFATDLINDFYEIDYTVSNNPNGEYTAVHSAAPVPGGPAVRQWKDVFIGVSFPHNYRPNLKNPVFGQGGDDRHEKMVIFVRDILGHFGDTNMDAYASTLRKATIKLAVIDLDRKLSICLTIHHALCRRNMLADVTPLSVEF